MGKNGPQLDASSCWGLETQDDSCCLGTLGPPKMAMASDDKGGISVSETGENKRLKQTGVIVHKRANGYSLHHLSAKYMEGNTKKCPSVG